MTAAASAARKSARPRAVQAAAKSRAPDTPEFEVAVIGAGFSGLCMAIQLKLAGIDSFAVFEKALDIGGTWRDNLYPGCACDVPSHLYSYSFEPNPNWSRMFAPQGEIWSYLRRCADKYGVLPHMRFGMEIRADNGRAPRGVLVCISPWTASARTRVLASWRCTAWSLWSLLCSAVVPA